MVSVKEIEEFVQWSYPNDIIHVDDEIFLNQIKQTVEKITNELNEISRDSLSEYLKNLSEDEREAHFELFRLLTGIAKTNFKIFFSHWLCDHNGAKIDILSSNRSNSKNKFALRLLYKGKQFSFSIKTFTSLCNEKEICHSVVEFFDQHKLISTLNIVKNDKSICNGFLESLVRFDSRGSDTNKRGKVAEKLTRKKLEEFGLEPIKDFNTSDYDIKDALITRLDFEVSRNKITTDLQQIKKEIKNNILERQDDIILTLDYPAIFVQSSFYASDVASIADATINELNAEKQIIKSTLQNWNLKYKFLGLIDGPGWAYSIGFSRLKRVLEVTPENFGIRTISTKLRRYMHECDITTPLDFEIGILFCKTNVTPELLFEQVARLYKIDKKILESDLQKWIKRKKILSNSGQIKFLPSREDIIHEYLVLDIIYYHGENNDSDILVPDGRSISKTKLLKILEQIQPELVRNLDKILVKLSTNGEIILK